MLVFYSRIERQLTSQIAGYIAGLAVVLLCGFAAVLVANPTAAKTPVAANDPVASAATATGSDEPGSYVIALLVSSPRQGQSERTEAIKYGAQLQIDTINQADGIGGQQVRLLILDDHSDPKQTIQNVSRALAEPRLIAMLGLASSSRGAAVLEAIGNSGVPFISDISVDKLFERYTNIFSMTSSISGDAQTFTRFLGENYQRAVFVGRKDDIFSHQFHAALQQQTKVAMTDVYWMPRDSKLFAKAADLAIAQIKATKPDIICLSVFSYHGIKFVKRLAAAGVHIPIYFATGSVSRVMLNTKDIGYKGALFGIGRGIPNVEGERLAHLGKRSAFRKMRNLFPETLGNGIIYYDLLAMIRNAGNAVVKNDTRRTSPNATASQRVQATPANAVIDPAARQMRQQITTGLGSYRQGRRVFHGLWRDWSFTPTRSAALNSFVLWAPDGGPDIKLWPVQYIRTLAGDRQAPVAFVNVDLVRIHQVDVNAKSFRAEFYLSLSSAREFDIAAMEFSNVVRGDDGAPFLNIREVHRGHAIGKQGGPALTPKSKRRPKPGRSTPSLSHLLPTATDTIANTSTAPTTQITQAAQQQDTQPAGQMGWFNKLYLIKGRFQFLPELGQYPFDSQRFWVAIQPVNATSPFLLQPNPVVASRPQTALIDGWQMFDGALGDYVGYDEDTVTLVRNYGADQLIMPFYKFNFSWVAKRLTKDYFVRVVVPLWLIMMVAYFSVFLPIARVDSIVAMQVTALLSTIALYFSIPKLETETATLSDQIFVFSEMIIVIMIVLTILRVNTILAKSHWVQRGLTAFHVVIFPVMAYLMLAYVLDVTTGTKKSIADETIGSFLYQILPTYFL